MIRQNDDPLKDDPVLGPIVEKSDEQLRDAGLLGR